MGTQADEARAREILDSDRAEDLLAAALTSSGPIQNLHINRRHLHHRPGLGLSVDYDVTYDSTQGLINERLVASTAPVARQSQAPGLVHMRSEDDHFVIWRLRDDPELPGLHTAFDSEWLLRIFHEAAPELQQLPAADLVWQLVSYRPTRRAVIRAQYGPVTLYLKVVQPAKSQDLAERTLLVASELPAPRLLHHSADGLVVTEAAVGFSLAHHLAQNLPLPTPTHIVQTLQRLPIAGVDLNRRPAWVDRIGFHASAAAARLPEAADEIADLAARFEHLRTLVDPGPLVVTHGDLYEANMFVQDGQISALIDVDSVGPGHMIDDIATLLGHMAVLPDLAPQTYPNVAEVVQNWWAEFAEFFHPVALSARTGAVILSLVAGGVGSHADARLHLAHLWCEHAESLLVPQ